MKQILLSLGKFTLVDDDDYEFLMQWKWYCNGHYAVRGKCLGYNDGKQIKKTIFLHRVIMNTPNDKYTDHINGDGLDNRKANLRICSNQENQRNRIKCKGRSSYKGVSWNIASKKWQAYIRLDKRNRYLGVFVREIDAAIAYNKAALNNFGEFSRTNAVHQDFD